MPRPRLLDTQVTPVPDGRLDRGTLTRLDTCPRCHAVILASGREPAFDHCRMCGRLWPIIGVRLADQVTFEALSGLQRA